MNYKRLIRRAICTLMHGETKLVIVDTIGCTVCEYKIIDKKERIIGYWAYGSWEPGTPWYIR